MSEINQPQIYYGEVIDINSDTYELTNTESNSNINTLFTVKVLIKENGNTRLIDAKPADINIKRIPIIGEVLIIIQLFNHTTSVDSRGYQWYYLNPIGIKSSINNNILSVNSTEFKPDSKFVESNVPLLQPYRGDLLIEGRYGNSIRFSNTVDTANSKYTNTPSWSGNSLATGNNPSPIIILSNGRKIDSVKSFTVENIQTDASSLYLTSTQSFPSLKLHNDLSSKADNASSFSKSQFIGIADRIILKSKTDIIALDSNSTIELNSPLLIIGNKQDSEKEWGLHSTEVIEMFNEFFYLITLGGLKDSTGMPIIADPAFADKFLDIREKLENKKIRQDKGN